MKSIPSLFIVALPLALAWPAQSGEPVSPPSTYPMSDQLLPPPKTLVDDGDWKFALSPYGYLSGLDGTVGVGPVSGDIDLDFDDIWGNLDTSFFLAFEGKKGRFGFFLDGFWLKLSASEDVGRNAKFDLELEQVLLNGYLTYEAIANDRLKLDLMAGARYSYLSTDVQLKTQNLPDIEGGRSRDWVDPVVGLRARFAITERLFLNTAADVGGFGVSSDLIWQLYAGIGYKLTEHFWPQIGWRHMEIDYDRGGLIYNVEMDGLMIGFNYSF